MSYTRTYRYYKRRRPIVIPQWLWIVSGGILGVVLGYVMAFAILDYDAFKIVPGTFDAAVKRVIGKFLNKGE